MTERQLTRFAAVLRDVGLERFAREHDYPVLLGGFEAPETDSGFRTLFEDQRGIPDRTTARRDERLPPEAQVFPIRKRPGGPFANQIGIGRARNTDVTLPGAEISKYHAFISRLRDGGYTITDAESANGTRVDGRALVALEPHELLDGSVVHFGPHGFRFHLPRGFLELVREMAGV